MPEKRGHYGEAAGGDVKCAFEAIMTEEGRDRGDRGIVARLK
jgi:hypothetical protein